MNNTMVCSRMKSFSMIPENPTRVRVSFGHIVNSACAANLDMQASDGACQRRDWASRRQYAEEFQTVRIDIGRSVGKTSYICKHAGPSDVIITHSWEARKWYNDNSTAPVIPVFSLLQHNAVFCPPASIVFVDEPSMMSENELNAIYERFSTSTVEQFVLLG